MKFEKLGLSQKFEAWEGIRCGYSKKVGEAEFCEMGEKAGLRPFGNI